MKKAVIRLVSVMLVLALVLGSTAALADGGAWECQNCGETGNTGNFCTNCGTARPSADWTCSKCGQAGNTGNFCSNCGTAKTQTADPVIYEPDPDPYVEVNPYLEQIPGETDRVMLCIQSVEASKYVSPKSNPTKWIPQNAIDGNETTCWQVRQKGDPKGKVWLQLNLPGEQTVEEIWFKNGFWAYNDQGHDQYHINARAKSVRISFLYAGETKFRDEAPLELKDEVFTGWQQFYLGRHEHVTAVKIAVWTKIMGTGGEDCENDICLSEVMLVQYAPAASAMPARETGPAVVYESRPEVSGAPLLTKLATRTGPGTEYEETGTFFIDSWKKQIVRVTGKHWDGSMWWVQVDFQNGKKAKYRVWTGLKRVDVDIDKVRENTKRGLCHVEATDAYAGPGTSYAKLGAVLFFEDEIDYYTRENGFVEIDYYDVNREIQRRVWVPQSAVSNYH